MQVLSPGLTGIIFLTCFFSTARLLFLFAHVLYLNATLSFQLFILFCLCVCVCVCVFFSVNNQLRQNTFDKRLMFFLMIIEGKTHVETQIWSRILSLLLLREVLKI